MGRKLWGDRSGTPGTRRSSFWDLSEVEGVIPVSVDDLPAVTQVCGATATAAVAGRLITGGRIVEYYEVSGATDRRLAYVAGDSVFVRRRSLNVAAATMRFGGVFTAVMIAILVGVVALGQASTAWWPAMILGGVCLVVSLVVMVRWLFSPVFRAAVTTVTDWSVIDRGPWDEALTRTVSMQSAGADNDSLVGSLDFVLFGTRIAD